MDKQNQFRDTVDGYFLGRKSPEAFGRLTKELEHWLPSGGWTTWTWFQVWDLSGHVQLPFPGGWVDQPSYVQRDFLLYLKVDSWLEMNESLPSTKGLKNLEDM